MPRAGSGLDAGASRCGVCAGPDAPAEQDPRREREHRPGLSPEQAQDLQQKAKAAGFWGIGTPEEYGGADLGPVMRSIIAMEVGRTFVPFNFGGTADNILYAGTEEQKQEYLIPTINGDRRSCFAITEPGAGSDARNIRTRAADAGQGHGSALAEEIERIARDDGRTVMQGWSEHGPEGKERHAARTGHGSVPLDDTARFLLGRGYTLEQVYRNSVLTAETARARIPALLDEALPRLARLRVTVTGTGSVAPEAKIAGPARRSASSTRWSPRRRGAPRRWRWRCSANAR